MKEHTMKIVFLSNYYTHHQKAVSDEMNTCCDYSFVATAQMTEERKALGWGMDMSPCYVCHFDQKPELAQEKLRQADVVITGSAPEKLVRRCILDNKLVLRYSERPLKHGIEPLKYLPRLVRWNWWNPPGKPIFLLCASAFAARDFARFGLFKGKTFRWGYFPATKRYDSVQELMTRKRKNSILWAGRLLDWKHPEDAIRIAKELKKNRIPFDLNIIGTGDLERTLQGMIVREKLEDCVHMLGAMKPEEVRRHMEESEIFLFTSDRREGWGAVLNEAMNSGCAAVAGHTIGAVPYLVKDGENAMIYTSGNVEELYNKVRYLLECPEERCRMGMNAVKTITEEWNGEEAARRLIRLIQALQTGGAQGLYQTGPCSPAEILEENWYSIRS